MSPISPSVLGAIQTSVTDNLSGYREFHTTSFDTPIWDTDLDGGAPRVIEFVDRPVIWVNPYNATDGSFAQQLIVPTNDSTAKDALRLSKRFASCLCHLSHGSEINDISNVSSPTWALAGNKLERTHLNGLDMETLFTALKPHEISDEMWIALAYYRLGINSSTDYYNFLSLYQIVELTGGRNKSAMKTWVNAEAAKSEFAHLRGLITLRSGQDYYGRLEETRNICAHVANTNNPKRQMLYDPDDPDSILQVQSDLPLLKKLVEEQLYSELGV